MKKILVKEFGIGSGCEAIGKMKQGKSDGPTGVRSEMLKAADETGTMWMTDVCNAVVGDGIIPEDWRRSWMVNVYKKRVVP